MRRRRRAVVVLALTSMLVGLGLVVAVGLRSGAPATAKDTRSSAAGSPVAHASASRSPVTASPGKRSAAVPGPTGLDTTTPRGLRPVEIAIPAIHVDARVGELGIAADGAVEVPTHVQQAGWLRDSPAPGERGPAVIAGHVDSTDGPAVFYELSDLKVGDAVVVTRRNGTQVRFTVDGVRRYAKAAFPTAETYGPVPGPALRLITCGGDFDRSRGGYQDNVVVFAS